MQSCLCVRARARMCLSFCLSECVFLSVSVGVCLYVRMSECGRCFVYLSFGFSMVCVCTPVCLWVWGWEGVGGRVLVCLFCCLFVLVLSLFYLIRGLFVGWLVVVF